MMYDIEVKVSLKPGMLNPEATTIQRSLALLGYEVNHYFLYGSGFRR